MWAFIKEKVEQGEKLNREYDRILGEKFYIEQDLRLAALKAKQLGDCEEGNKVIDEAQKKYQAEMKEREDNLKICRQKLVAFENEIRTNKMFKVNALKFAKAFKVFLEKETGNSFEMQIVKCSYSQKLGDTRINVQGEKIVLKIDERVMFESPVYDIHEGGATRGELLMIVPPQQLHNIPIPMLFAPLEPIKKNIIPIHCIKLEANDYFGLFPVSMRSTKSGVDPDLVNNKKNLEHSLFFKRCIRKNSSMLMPGKINMFLNDYLEKNSLYNHKNKNENSY